MSDEGKHATGESEEVAPAPNVEPEGKSSEGKSSEGKSPEGKSPEGMSGEGMAADVVAAAPEAPPSDGATCAVNFVIQQDGYRHTMVIPVGMLISEVKAAVGGDLRIHADNIIALMEGKVLEDGQSLGSYGVAAGQQGVEVELRVEYRSDQQGYTMPNEIAVEVHYDDDLPPKSIMVKIEKQLDRKKYLGGYRHKRTGAEYHHSGSQTAFPDTRKKQETKDLLTRETQTVVQTTRAQQTKRESSVQMARPGLMLDDSRDYEIKPRPYFSAAQLADLKLRKTIVIQCYWRGYRARCRAHDMRVRLEERKRRIREAEEQERADAEARHKKEVARRMHPRKFEDFEILYNELEAWRSHETRRIHDMNMDEGEKMAALAQLLHKETKLLQTIDRLKITANGENRDLRIKKMLALMASPKEWEMRDGEGAEVHTPFTTRAKELLELYNGLALPLLTVDERLDVLLHVKWTVKEFDCNLTRSIVELIDREADLLNRARSEKSLEGLRKRLLNLFLQFIETPEFNPEAARFQKVPQDLSQRPNVQPIHDKRPW